LRRHTLRTGGDGTHTGGRRCQVDDCKRSAVAGIHCIAHGGGHRCQELACCKGAIAGGTPHCKAHGGGRRCLFEGCDKGTMAGSMTHCRPHNGHGYGDMLASEDTAAKLTPLVVVARRTTRKPVAVASTRQ
jgi:hypothetical protein